MVTILTSMLIKSPLSPQHFFDILPTMTLSMKDLEKTVQLAHITIKEEKKEAYLSQLNDILDQVKTIDALDLDNIEPTSTVVEQDQYKREDVAVTPADLLLEKNAPHWEQNAFRVPRILKR